MTWPIPLAHQVAVDRFIAGWPIPLGPSGPKDRAAPVNAHVLAFVHSLRDPVAAFFEPDRFLDEIAWAALGYYRPGDRFRVDDAWLMKPYDNAVSLETMLRAWAARQPRTWTIASPYKPLLQMEPSAVRKEAMFWWDRLKAERAAGREPMPPGTDTTALSIVDSVQPMPRLSTPVFFGVVTAFIAAGIGAAYLVARRR
jgi:hypothetical protein